MRCVVCGSDKIAAGECLDCLEREAVSFHSIDAAILADFSERMELDNEPPLRQARCRGIRVRIASK